MFVSALVPASPLVFSERPLSRRYLQGWSHSITCVFSARRRPGLVRFANRVVRFPFSQVNRARCAGTLIQRDWNDLQHKGCGSVFWPAECNLVRLPANQKEENSPMKTRHPIFVSGMLVLGLATPAIVCEAAQQQDAPPPQTSNTTPVPPRDAAPPARRPGPPPPPACGPGPAPQEAAVQGPATTFRSSVKQLNYGPEGEVTGLLLSNGTQVNFPPEMGTQIASIAKEKSQVSVVGYSRQSISGRNVVDATSITAGGQTITAPAVQQVPPPPPPAGGPDAGPPQN